MVSLSTVRTHTKHIHAKLAVTNRRAAVRRAAELDLPRTRLVPRIIPAMGLIGGPLLIIAVFAALFGQHTSLTGLAALPMIPVAAWEFSLGVWLALKGFRPSPITAEIDVASPPRAYQSVAV